MYPPLTPHWLENKTTLKFSILMFIFTNKKEATKVSQRRYVHLVYEQIVSVMPVINVPFTFWNN